MVKICIVGGGSSGWMTAAAFARRFPHFDITLVEGKTTKPIGVGESTLGHFNRYIQCLGIEDHEWMSACNATYKTSIQFTNWKGTDDVFQYPFGDQYFECGDFLSWYHLHNLFPDEFPDTTFAEFYNPSTYLASANKICEDQDRIPNFRMKWDAAYHFDASLFGEWLKNNLCQNVKHCYDDIDGCDINYKGEIDYIVSSESGNKYRADYYIDCTGFKSLLLEQWMGSEFISFENDLPNDSAVAAHVDYVDREHEMITTTDGYALSDGWLWTIPLWNRLGKGFVYSSKFTNQDDAERMFREHTGHQGEVNHIKFRHGKRELGWKGNVIGIGLSYGFLEPLESTGLFTTHENILRLVDTFERRDGKITQLDIDGFNHAVSYELEAMKEFVMMHYYLSPRDDSDYWRYYTERSPLTYDEMFDKVVRSPRLYQEFIHNYNIANAPKDLGGLVYIAAGLGYHPISPTDTDHSMARGEFTLAEADRSRQTFARRRHSVLKFLDKQPTHYEYLRQHVYKEEP